MSDDPHRAYKTALSRYATGVTVVGARDAEDRAIGITVNSFASVSLEPRLVLWCIDRGSALFDLFAGAEAYAVSVLGAGDEQVSNRFASPDSHHFEPDDLDTMSTGAPLLKSRLAGFDCRVRARHEAGDHLILIGEAVDFDCADGDPLLYVNSGYAELRDR